MTDNETEDFELMTKRFSLGVDLGTTNCAVALTDLESDQTEVLEITQVVGPNQIGEKSILPSALYIPHRDEFPENAFPLPWQDETGDSTIIGHFARDHGALVPDRLVTSAKSWLSNAHIDPRHRSLPWRSEIPEEKLSPFECSRRYLAHLKSAFLYAGRVQGRNWDLSESEIVLTVPASFDAVARNLTAEAAEAAGLGKVTLLEEPQAAFYAWIAQTGREWRSLVGPGDIILVCDVGGGTTDFSLIAVTDNNGTLELDRISVGEHILLGGDNMDLALAYTLQAQLEAEGKSIDSWQFLALVHAASKGKVGLFDDDSLTETPIAVPSRGSSLFARTVSTKLDRATLEQVVLDGFFAKTAISDLPQEARRIGLQEFGLPFAADPVISKHLARFLVRTEPISETVNRFLRWWKRNRGQANSSCRPLSFSTAVFSRVDRSATGFSSFSLRGTKDKRFASCEASNWTSPWQKGLHSTGELGSPEKASGSRPEQRDHTTSGSRPRCRLCQGSNRR